MCKTSKKVTTVNFSQWILIQKMHDEGRENSRHSRVLSLFFYSWSVG